MTNSKEAIIINHILEREIPLEIKNKIIPIIKENIERVKFVKAASGLRDILYFEEDGVEFLDFPFYLSLDCPVSLSENSSKHENVIAVYENAITDTEEIKRKLNFFFSTTNRNLYIEVAFIENLMSNDDAWAIFHKMNNDNTKEPYELIARHYDYPEWYQVEFGEDIAFNEFSLETLRTLETQLTGKYISSLYKEIDVLLEKDAISDIPPLVEEIKKLK